MRVQSTAGRFYTLKHLRYSSEHIALLKRIIRECPNMKLEATSDMSKSDVWLNAFDIDIASEFDLARINPEPSYAR